jgi:hypothetical protein
MNAYDSGQIRQETNCLPVPEISELSAEVLGSTRDDVDAETWLLENYPLPFILLLDIQNVQPGGYFDSVYLFPRDDELPGIASNREVVALVNVCSNAKIPTALRIEAEDMRWTLYALTRQ